MKANEEVERVEKDSGEIIGALAGAVAVVALLPAVVVALVVVVALRALHRAWWWAGVPAVVAVAVVALYPGLGAAAHGYVAGYGSVIGQMTHHGHAGVAAILAGVLPLAAVLGCILGTVGAVLAERKWPLAGGPGKARAGQPHHGRGMRPDAPTATRREVRDLVVNGAEDRRLVLGKAHGRWVAAGAEDHIVVVAPTGSGKTSAMVIPAILRLAGPLVATSSKGDIIEDGRGGGTLAWRQKLGACHVFDPSGSTNYPCVPWSPLGRAVEWQGALAVSRTMLAAAGRGGKGATESGTASFFSSRAEMSLAPLLHAAALGELDMGDVLSWVRKRDWEPAEGLLDGDAAEALGNLTAGSKESMGDTLATILTVLRPYEDPTIRRNTSEPIWTPAELLEGSDTLYIIYGPDAERLSPVFTALIDETIDAARRKALRDGPLNPPLWLLLDEAGTGLALSELPATLARSRGEGIRFLTAWQDLGQIRRQYGDEGRSGILGNSAAQAWWPPDDGDTARYLSDALGHQQVRQVSRSKSKGKGDTSESESIGSMAVLDAGEARTLAGPLLLYRGKPAAQLETVPYYKDKMLKRRASTAMAEAEVEPVVEDVENTVEDAEEEPLAQRTS